MVSRGGRPDLAGRALGRVAAPTLLMVGESDASGLLLNRAAAVRLRCPGELAVVPGAGRRFDEPLAAETCAALAEEWFRRHLATSAYRNEPGS